MIKPSIFIGLGGVGIQTILKTKALFLDNIEFQEILSPYIFFVGIDTDEYDLSMQISSKNQLKVSLEYKEICNIAVPPQKIYEFVQYHRRNIDWLPQQNRYFMTPLNHSPRMVRSDGRLAFIYKIAALKNYLLTILTEMHDSICRAKNGVNNIETDKSDGISSIDINIVFSLCGSTGSGIFLDIAYLLQEIRQETNIKITLNGYGILPSTLINSLSQHATSTNSTLRTYLFGNSYAAISELDYLMKLKKNKLSVQLPWKEEKQSEPPFEKVTLIDNNGSVEQYKLSQLTDILSRALYMRVIDLEHISKSMGDSSAKPADDSCGVEDICTWLWNMGVSTLVYDSEYVAKVYELKAQNKQIIEGLDKMKFFYNNSAVHTSFHIDQNIFQQMNQISYSLCLQSALNEEF